MNIFLVISIERPHTRGPVASTASNRCGGNFLRYAMNGNKGAWIGYENPHTIWISCCCCCHRYCCIRFYIWLILITPMIAFSYKMIRHRYSAFMEAERWKYCYCCCCCCCWTKRLNSNTLVRCERKLTIEAFEKHTPFPLHCAFSPQLSDFTVTFNRTHCGPHKSDTTVLGKPNKNSHWI